MNGDEPDTLTVVMRVGGIVVFTVYEKFHILRVVKITFKILKSHDISQSQNHKSKILSSEIHNQKHHEVHKSITKSREIYSPSKTAHKALNHPLKMFHGRVYK